MASKSKSLSSQRTPNQQATEEGDVTPLLDRYGDQGEREDSGSEAPPPMVNMMPSPDMEAMLQFMQDQETARQVALQDQETARQKAWMELEMKKLELKERKLRQLTTAEEARRAAEETREENRLQLQITAEATRRIADEHREEERRKERVLDRRLRETAQLPRMKEDEDVEIYLESFESRLLGLEIPVDRWMANLRPLLSNWAAQVAEALDQTDRLVYSKVQHVLLEAYSSAKGPLGIRTLAPKKEPKQTMAQFCARQRRTWAQWTKGRTESEIGVRGTLVQAELALPYAARMHMRIVRPKSIPEFVTEVEDYFAARNTTWDEAAAVGRRGQRWPPESTGQKPSFQQPRQTQGKETSHVGQGDQWADKKSDHTTSARSKEKNTECFSCGKKGHYAAQCPDRQVRINRISTPRSFMVSGRIGDQETDLMLDSGASMSLFPAKFIQQEDYTGGWMTVKGAVGEQSLQTARVTVVLDGVTDDMRVLVTTEDTTPLLGTDYPHFDDALWGELARKRDKRVRESTSVPLQVAEIRAADAEESSSLEETDLDSLTEDADEEMQLRESTPDPLQVVESRTADADSLTEDVDDEMPGEEVFAVQTRSQQERERRQQQQDDVASASSGAIPLDLSTLDDSLFGQSKDRRRLTRSQKQKQTRDRDEERTTSTAHRQLRLTEFTPSDLEEAQREDVQLLPFWQAAEADKDGFHVGKGLLRHCSEDDWGDMRDQLVVPTRHRLDIIEMAHGAKLSAHLGNKRTAKKILRDFYWPGVTRDVTAFCKSCEGCQRGSRTAVARAPLQPLPVMEEPFRRVAIDIVGPLQRTKQGNKFVLTLMDFATRYPEAIPLRKTDAATVAEALCHIFTRLGLPQEILSDQGSNFRSDLMKQVAAILGIDRIQTSPYHPQTNGMLERFHATLKSMIRKSSQEKSEWDRYLPYACFAFRDTTHSATGYTPFQLLFGRDVRGPLSLLYEQLTTPSGGTQPVSEYVDGLKTRLRDAWSLAAERDVVAKAEGKKHFDAKARSRSFGVGNQVLVTTPSLTSKLDNLWNGPYTVEEKVNEVTYRVRTPDRRKKSRLFHINGLKPWRTPATVLAVRFCEEDLTHESQDPEVLPFRPQEVGAPAIGEQLTDAQRGELRLLLREHEAVFDTIPGHTEVVEHTIKTGDHKPIYHPPYRLPQAWQSKVREEIRSMAEAGIIVPSSSPWTSPLVPIRKKDGNLRLCVDYRRLNQVTQEDRYPMPRVEELLELLGKARFITTLDLTKGYYQVSVHPKDREKTAFMGPMGKFHFTRMPFGLKGAPTTFQRLMDMVLDQCASFARAYIDDIVIFSLTWGDHKRHLAEVFTKLREAGLKAKPTKCHIATDHCAYLGHIVGGGRIAMEEAKIAALRDYLRPITKRDVRAFLGLAGYYRRFVPAHGQNLRLDEKGCTC